MRRRQWYKYDIMVYNKEYNDWKEFLVNVHEGECVIDILEEELNFPLEAYKIVSVTKIEIK